MSVSYVADPSYSRDSRRAIPVYQSISYLPWLLVQSADYVLLSLQQWNWGEGENGGRDE
jgi:hypothetical protein